MSVSYRAVVCDVITEHSKAVCKTCSSALNAIKRAAKSKTKASSAPAKPKAPLSACGPEELWAIVISSRLHVKDLKERLQKLQGEIQKDGI